MDAHFTREERAQRLVTHRKFALPGSPGHAAPTALLGECPQDRLPELCVRAPRWEFAAV